MKVMRKKYLFFPILVSLILVLGACSNNNEETQPANEELEGVEIQELVRDYSERNITDQTASITSQQLIMTDSEGKESVYDLSEEDFFVSIAPYVNETHH